MMTSNGVASANSSAAVARLQAARPRYRRQRKDGGRRQRSCRQPQTAPAGPDAAGPGMLSLGATVEMNSACIGRIVIKRVRHDRLLFKFPTLRVRDIRISSLGDAAPGKSAPRYGA